MLEIGSKMIIINMDHHHHLKGPNRRSRKVVEGRDFDCGCGKAYLSYPALLTHIKTKH